MYNYISKVATIVSPISNVMDRGVVVCTAAGSFFVSLQLTNDCVVPVSNLTDTGNLWLLIIKYKRLCYILMLLNLS